MPLSSLGSADEEDVSLPDRMFNASGRWTTPLQGWRILDPESEAMHRQGVRLLGEALGALPENQRLVVTLRDVDGLGSDEVCEVLRISEADQRVLLHRGRQRLREALEAAETPERLRDGEEA